MDLNFGFQRNEEETLDKLFRRQLKKKNRRHIVTEMIEVKKARKEAVSEKENYYKYKDGKFVKKAKKVRKRAKKVKRNIFKAFWLKLKKKVYSYQSVYLYCWYTILDGIEHIRERKGFYQRLAAVLFVFMLGAVVVEYTTCYEVTLNGYYLGRVKDISVVQQALSNVDSRMSQWYENENMYYEKTITAKRSFTTDHDMLLTVDECEKSVYDCDISIFVNGGVVMVDGKETVRLSSKKDAQDAIDSFLAVYSAESEDVIFKEMEVFQDITVEERIVDVNGVYSVSEAVDYMKALSGDKEAEKNISQLQASVTDFGSSASELSALTFRQDDFSIGETSKPTLTIKTVKEVNYTDIIPYETKNVNDSTIYRGVTKVTTKGVNGKKKVTALITYVNGNEQAREILAEEVIDYPVAEIIAQGTKALPPAVSTGTFLIPATGNVTTLYGTSSHAGGCAVDIANGTGTNIYASDAGVVTMASDYGTYGNCIKIQHANGYSTLYAHLNSFNCEVGDEVRQGQVIGYMGSTGYSTGPHLHFEIRYNNVRQKIELYFENIAYGSYVTALQ